MPRQSSGRRDDDRKHGPDAPPEVGAHRLGQQGEKRLAHHADGHHEDESPQQQHRIPPLEREMPDRSLAAAEPTVGQHQQTSRQHRSNVGDGEPYAPLRRVQRIDGDAANQPDKRHRQPRHELHAQRDAQHGEEVADRRERGSRSLWRNLGKHVGRRLCRPVFIRHRQ